MKVPTPTNLTTTLIFIISFTAASVYTINEHPHYKDMFPPVNDSYSTIGNSIEKNTGYNDIVFSPDFEYQKILHNNFLTQ